MRRRGFNVTLLIAASLAVFSLIRYCSSRTVNPITGDVEYISMTPDQEVAMGLNSRDQLAQEFGGYYPDKSTQRYVDSVGHVIVDRSDASQSPYEFNFYVLSDQQTVNAFALPGGQVFITIALLSNLSNEDELAGVLGHEIGHVIERHSAERIAETQLYQGLGNAAIIASGDVNTQEVTAMVIGSTLRAHGRKDELQADDLGVKYMMQAGYNPYAMVQVMEVLKRASAASASSQPEFMSTHPSPDHREEEIEESIAKYKRLLPDSLTSNY